MVQTVKVKVKFTIEQVTKVKTGVEVQSYFFFNLGARWGLVVNATPWPLYPGKDPVPIVQEAGWAPGPVWTGAENFTPTGIRSPDGTAPSKSLYRLSYPGPWYRQCLKKLTIIHLC